MRILGLRQCELLERLKRDHSESLSHKVEFDHQFWEEVMARLVRGDACAHFSAASSIQILQT